jgi:putative DNA primase/helicase
VASGVPTVAAYSAGNLAAWKWPALRRIVVFGDADAAGRKSAEELRLRALAAGLKCSLLFPAIEGTDWCDSWAARAAVPELNGGHSQ